MEYLLILLVLLFVTMFIDWKYKIRLYRSKKERIEIPILFFIFGTMWDSYAVWRGHWYFNMAHLL